VLGKYAGLVLTLLVNTGIMALCFFALLAAKGMADVGLAKAITLLFMQFLLVTAIAILFSCLSNPIISCILTLALYVIGHLLWSFDMLRERLTSPVSRALCRGMAWILPNLEHFDIKGEVVHGLEVPPGRLLFAALYLLLYGGAVLALACAAFERRELQ
jgi:hypothetical protein